MLGEHRRFFLWMTLAGLVLRLLFLVCAPAVTDDSHSYLDFASNWLLHGVYGQTELAQIVPTDTRLPGYPAFLAVVFWICGVGNIRAVLVAQILFDLVTCLLIADLARRTVPGRLAARAAFALAVMCPFLANYAAAVLAETVEIFFTVLALDCAAAALEGMQGTVESTPGGRHRPPTVLWAASGLAIGACILLRPDGGILLVGIALYIALAAVTGVFHPKQPASLKRCPDINRFETSAQRFRGLLLAEIIVVGTALAPLVPWTIRNFRTLHHFQPLAPRYANETEELAPRGFNRWVATWMVDYVSVEEIYWNVPGDKIDVGKLPERALDEPAREATLALIADYDRTQDLTPELDARFDQLAAERIRAHPFRYYVALPTLRVTDMWLRPRTELLPPDIRWWEFHDDPKESALAVGFGLLNLFYVGAAVLAVIGRRAQIRYIGLLAGFVLLRTVFLGTLENPEPRYTLECYPVVIVLAAAFLVSGKFRRSPQPNCAAHGNGDSGWQEEANHRGNSA